MDRSDTDALHLPPLRPPDRFRALRGSSRCAFQVGVIETLREIGVRPALCVGVSGGAWNAAAVAAGTSRPHITLVDKARVCCRRIFGAGTSTAAFTGGF